MKLSAIIFITLTITLVTSTDVSTKWRDFKVKYKKYYTSVEEPFRFNIFKENVEKIEEHNSRYKRNLESYSKGINQFTDLTHEERQKLYGGISEDVERISKVLMSYKPPKSVDIPERLDYRDLNAVTSIKNQGMCACCYAFTALGTLESHIILKKNKIYDLSEQNLVDCAVSYGTHGCTSGSVRHAYEYINYIGIMNETDYPYAGTEQKCKFKYSKKVFNINGFKVLPSDEDALLQVLIQDGPIAAPVDGKELYEYQGGIFEPKLPYSGLSHGVIIIGYGRENGTDYWLVKNSWGEDWGEKGFGKIRRKPIHSIGIDKVAVIPVL